MRRTQLERLKSERFDVLVLGGGINGAGVARDLGLRGGLKVALVEQRHFASGTSGKNSQLIHGGLRYLKNLEFGLVREGLRERSTLLRLAPHLVEPLPFLMPIYSRFDRLYSGAGLWVYDALAGRHSLGRHRTLAPEAVARLEPGLARQGLVGAARFFDCRVNSARFVLANVWDAMSHGVVAANYVRAERPERDAAGWRVRLHDTLSGENLDARARKLVDTTGPWSRAGQLRLVRGSHLVLPRLTASEHAIAFFEQAGRIVFVIPWGENGRLSLVGTTDVDHQGGPEAVAISAEETRYLLRIAARLFPEARLEPLAAYSSLRGLVRDESASATATSREHRIWESSEGILHVAGGKYTTYRAMSEETADAVTAEIAPDVAKLHRTASTPLEGATVAAVAALRKDVPRLAAAHGLEEEEVRRLVTHYGVHTPALLESLPASAPAGLSRSQAGRVAYAVRHEMAQRLPDLMFVSTYWGYEQQWEQEGLQPYARAMGALLGWDQRQIEQEIELVICQSALPGASCTGPAHGR